MKLSFTKEDGTWYIDLPQWIENGGSKGALAMVSGADTLLDELSINGKTCAIELCSEEDSDVALTRTYSLGWGYYYSAKSKKEHVTTNKIWLCPVTKFVFKGKYPKIINFKVI